MVDVLKHELELFLWLCLVYLKSSSETGKNIGRSAQIQGNTVHLKCAKKHVVLTCLSVDPVKLPVFTGYDMFLAHPPKNAT